MFLYVLGAVSLGVWLLTRARPAGREVAPARVQATTLGEYLLALRDAYAATDLPRDAIPLAVTHSAMATGAWQPFPARSNAPASSVYPKGGPPAWNNNIGVIRSTSGWAGDYARLGTDEVIDGVRVHQTGQAFRAYASMADSARDAVRLWRTARYRPAYDRLVALDPGWSGELGRRGYYTADPAIFEAGYRIRLGKVRAILGA